MAPSHAKCLYLRHRRVSHGMDTLLVIDHDIMKASTSSGSRGSIFVANSCILDLFEAIEELISLRQRYPRFLLSLSKR